MEPIHLAITELILFFVLFPVVFKAVMTIEVSKYFKKGAVWQIQIMTIFSIIIFTYLITRALMHLIELSSTIFTSTAVF